MLFPNWASPGSFALNSSFSRFSLSSHIYHRPWNEAKWFSDHHPAWESLYQTISFIKNFLNFLHYCSQQCCKTFCYYIARVPFLLVFNIIVWFSFKSVPKPLWGPSGFFSHPPQGCLMNSARNSLPVSVPRLIPELMPMLGLLQQQIPSRYRTMFCFTFRLSGFKHQKSSSCLLICYVDQTWRMYLVSAPWGISRSWEPGGGLTLGIEINKALLTYVWQLMSTSDGALR